MRGVLRCIIFPTVEDCVGSKAQDLIDELITESFPDVGPTPEQADGDTALEDGVSTGTNSRTGGNEDHPAEQGDSPQNTVGGDTADPQLGRWVLNNIGSPVTSARDDEGELVPLWLGYGGKSVPFLERRVSNPDGGTGVRASCWIVSQRDQTHDKSGRRTVVEVQPGSML